MTSLITNTISSISGTLNLATNVNLTSGKTLTVTGSGTTTFNGLLLANLGVTITGTSSLAATNISGITTIFNNTASSSIITGALVVTGGAGISGDLFIGATGNFAGIANHTNTTGIPSTSNTPSGALVSSGGFGFIGSGTLSNAIMFNTSGLNVPTTTISRTSGSRIILYPNFSNGVTTDYGIGMTSTGIWYGVGSTTTFHYFYHNTTLSLTLGSSSSTLASSFSVTDTTGVPSAVSSNTPTGSFVSSGAIALTGSSNYKNVIMFAAVNSAEPNGPNTTRSFGSKLILWSNLTATATDYAIGIGSASMWYQVDVGSVHNWYTGGTKIGNWNSSLFTITTPTSVTDTTASTTTGTGSLILGGGLGVAKTINTAGITITKGSGTVTLGSSATINGANGTITINSFTLAGNTISAETIITNSSFASNTNVIQLTTGLTSGTSATSAFLVARVYNSTAAGSFSFFIMNVSGTSYTGTLQLYYTIL